MRHYVIGCNILFQHQHYNVPMCYSHMAGHAMSSKANKLKHVMLQLFFLLDTKEKLASFSF